jgi:osmotically-inducible protein OsmY
MKRALLITAFACGLLFADTGFTQTRGGRYDQQILSNVARVLAGDPQYQNVTVKVEDGIVILSGNVQLDSARRNLSVRVLHIAHVEGVENQLVLAPPAPPDQILSSRVLSRLQDAGYKDVTVQVHEGTVILLGTVRNQRDWNSAKEIVSLTPGVKEVEARLQIATPWITPN